MLRKPLPGALRRRTGLILVAAMVVSGSYAAWAAQPARSATPMPGVGKITDSDVLNPPAWPKGVAMDRTGNVMLNLLVDADGKVTQVKVESSDSAGVFDAAAVEAASQWRFNKARDTLGNKVQGWVRVPLQFAPSMPTAAPAKG